MSELFVAVSSFGMWGLVVPGSALYGILRPPALPITVTALAAAGGLLVTLVFIPWHKRPAKRKGGTGQQQQQQQSGNAPPTPPQRS